MPPRKRIEATVFIVDCSSHVEERLKLLNKIHAMKYFAQTKGAMKDLQKIILYNHPGLKSKHVVNEWSYYSFEVLKIIKTQIANTDSEYRSHNFLYALNGALEAFNSNNILPEYIKRILFITDLSSNMDWDEKTNTKINFIKEEMIEIQAWLYVIGLNIKLPVLFKQHEISKLNKIVPVGELTPALEKNYEILRKIDKNVAFVDKEHGLDVFFAHKINPKGPFNWYVKMNIGPDIKIPVVVYRTTKPHETIKFQPCPSVSGQGLTNNKVWYDVNTHERVQDSDIVKGYKFQEKFVEISEEQIRNLKIVTPKCLTIFGFANANEVPLKMFLMPDNLNCVKPDIRGSQSADDRRFALFVTSLRVRNVVALAYRVYNNGNSRKFVCLFPCPEHKNDGHLLMGQLPYEHEFHEDFVRGKIEETPYKSDTFETMSAFLDTLSPFDGDDKKELYPLPPSMQVSRSRARMAEFLASKVLEVDPGEAPNVTMKQVHEEKGSAAIDQLLKECLSI